MKDTLTQADIEYLRALRGRGFAVIVFTPGELINADQEDVEDAAITAGNARVEYENAQEAP